MRTTGINPENITHQYLGLFLLIKGFAFLSDEGRGQLIQVSLRLPLGQSGQLLLHHGPLTFKAKSNGRWDVLTSGTFFRHWKSAYVLALQRAWERTNGLVDT